MLLPWKMPVASDNYSAEDRQFSSESSSGEEASQQAQVRLSGQAKKSRKWTTQNDCELLGIIREIVPWNSKKAVPDTWAEIADMLISKKVTWSTAQKRWNELKDAHIQGDAISRKKTGGNTETTEEGDLNSLLSETVALFQSDSAISKSKRCKQIGSLSSLVSSKSSIRPSSMESLTILEAGATETPESENHKPQTPNNTNEKSASKKVHANYMASQLALNQRKSELMDASMEFVEAARGIEAQKLNAAAQNEVHRIQMEMLSRERADKDDQERLERARAEEDIQHQITMTEMRLTLLRKQKEEKDLRNALAQ